MDLNSIRSALREQPFRPFELWLVDGRRIPVTHPEFVAMNQRIVVVAPMRESCKGATIRRSHDFPGRPSESTNTNTSNSGGNCPT